MASISPSASGKWGRRNLDAPVNLVPYIDLMISIIAFLMMTAIWTQIATLEVQNASSPAAVTSASKAQPLFIEISSKGFVMGEDGKRRIEIPYKDGQYDMALLYENLKKWKQENPSCHQVDVFVHDGIIYNHIAKVVDLAVGLKMPDVLLKPLTLNESI